MTRNTPVLLDVGIDLNQAESFIIPHGGFESNARRANLPVEAFKINATFDYG